MGYHIDSLPSGRWDFKIMKENFGAIINAFYRYDLETRRKYLSQGNISYLKDPPRPYKDIDELFKDMGYTPEYNERGDIDNIYLDHENLWNDESDFTKMAPWVEAGSCLDFIGEDYSIWRWFFDGDEMIEVGSEVIFPDTPLIKKPSFTTMKMIGSDRYTPE